MAYKTKLRTILAKSEPSYGVNSSPAAADAVLVNSDLALTPLAGDVVQRDVIRPYMGAYEGLLTNTQVRLTASVEYAGSGTAGTAPRYSPLLRSSRLSETVMGTALTGTSQAGASGSITLAAAASAVNDAYTGMVVSITSGTGNGHVGLITQYVGSTKVATVAAYSSTFVPGVGRSYGIGAHVRYMPISTIDGNGDCPHADRLPSECEPDQQSGRDSPDYVHHHWHLQRTGGCEPGDADLCEPSDTANLPQGYNRRVPIFRRGRVLAVEHSRLRQ